MCVSVCKRRKEREKYTREHKMGDELTILEIALASSKYKNTFHEVYIGSMCNGAHVWVEYSYKGVTPKLND